MPLESYSTSYIYYRGVTTGFLRCDKFIMVVVICPPDWDRVIESENLGVTMVTPVILLFTPLYSVQNVKSEIW